MRYRIWRPELRETRDTARMIHTQRGAQDAAELQAAMDYQAGFRLPQRYELEFVVEEWDRWGTPDRWSFVVERIPEHFEATCVREVCCRRGT